MINLSHKTGSGEFVRYPIKNSTIKDHFQKLGIIEVDTP